MNGMVQAHHAGYSYPGTARALWNTSMTAQWWTGVALLGAARGGLDPTFIASGGDWYDPPYPFWVRGGPLATGGSPTSETAAVPGSVWASGGVSPVATYSGMSFASDGAYFAAYGSGDDAFPSWSDAVPGVSGNWWELAAPIASSANGSLIAYGLTAMARYDPLGPKHAEVAVVDASAFPPRVVLADATWANGTGLQDLHLTADGGTLVVIAAVDPAGRINSSEVRVYDVAGGARAGGFVTGYVYASCLSPDGRTLALATCDSENAVEVWALREDGSVSQLVNSSYPPLPGTFTFAATCALTPAGALWMTFPLWWGGAINQTAVAHWAALPAAPIAPGPLPPTSLWLSPPIAPGLQDDVIDSAYAGGVFAYTSWGGAALNASESAPTPPTLHLFADAAPDAPWLELSTPATDGAGAVSGSLGSLDMAVNASGGGLLVMAEGRNGHANQGSSGGVLYLWEVSLPAAAASAAAPTANFGKFSSA